jgi:hypothetical protein
MRVQKVLTATQKKLDLPEKALLEMELPPKQNVNVAPPHPKEGQANAFARVFRSDLLRNIDRPPQAHRFIVSSLHRRNRFCCFHHSDNVKSGG